MVRKNFIGSGNDGFVCDHCGLVVLPHASGGYRNHCPACLFSKHVDILPGDRSSSCGGLMRPISAHHSSKKGWVVLHRCLKCGYNSRNKTSHDASQSDNFSVIITLTQ